MVKNHFGNTHIDAKFHEEVESGVIFALNLLKNVQKLRFVSDFRDFRKIEFSENLKQIAVFDHF